MTLELILKSVIKQLDKEVYVIQTALDNKEKHDFATYIDRGRIMGLEHAKRMLENEKKKHNTESK